MAELMFVERCNNDKLGRRVICRYMETENTISSVNEIEDEKVNKMCGLSGSDVDMIRVWLSGKDNSERLL